ncbi:MAG TPA: hypothetical protein PKD17_08395 [Cellvibrionaceae bacterium]|nr:hypothetical protein [Cellvibrionaceae bacterium]HMW71825.1 hypothetical protein [Cellvibrionaceae bacterium]HMY40753.1 hypothetical protein [Marinagarivorans sp.]
MALTLEKITTIIARSLRITPTELYEAFAPATENELADIIQFRQTQLGKSIAWQDEAYLRWRYDFSGNLTSPLNRLWRVKINGELLGLIGLDYVQLNCRGERIDASNPLDLVVLAKLDGLGLGVWMSLVLQQDNGLMFAMGATKSSKTIVQKLFTPMADLGSWKYLLHSSRYLHKKVHPLLLPIAAKCVDTVLNLTRKWLGRGKKKPWQIAPVLNFTLHAQQLDALMDSYKDTLWVLRQRSADFLQWRFLTNPRRQYNALGLFHEGLLAGYAVYHIKGKSHLHIDDLFTAANNLKGLQALVVALLEIASLASVDLVCFTAHNELWQTLMIPMGFTFREDAHLFGVAVKDSELQAHFIDPTRWWVTSCDTHSEGF